MAKTALSKSPRKSGEAPDTGRARRARPISPAAIAQARVLLRALIDRPRVHEGGPVRSFIVKNAARIAEMRSAGQPWSAIHSALNAEMTMAPMTLQRYAKAALANEPPPPRTRQPTPVEAHIDANLAVIRKMKTAGSTWEDIHSVLSADVPMTLSKLRAYARAALQTKRS